MMTGVVPVTVFFQVVGVLIGTVAIGLLAYMGAGTFVEKVFGTDDEVAAEIGIFVGIIFAVAFFVAIVSSGEASPDRCGIGTVMIEGSTWNGKTWTVDRVCVVEMRG